jgi:hypothetical protein
LAILAQLAAIEAKTALISNGRVTTTSTTAINGKIPHLIRGDDYTPASRNVTHNITAPADAGAVASCRAVFAGWHPELQMGWSVNGTVEDAGSGVWRLRSGPASSDTLPLKPSKGYEWTHTLIDANGKIRTQIKGETELIDGFAVARYSA